MARLFENFVFNFYRIERKNLNIRKERIYWEASSESDPDFRFLPTMETDISVRSSDRTLIIDTKFYKETFQKYYDRQSIHSPNLYQVFSYLKNLELREGPDGMADGMLLYPVVEKPIRLEYRLSGHSVRINTLDLSADWQDIRRELLSFVEMSPEVGSAGIS
jgi:5-methylcytosine-specific restriction enzyme subunit McrC